MKKAKTSSKKNTTIRPAINPEAQETRLVALATQLAEQQLMDGTASSQVITHYLKLGSTKERLERELMEKKKELMDAKTEAIKSAKRVEELYSEALNAMRRYSGSVVPHEEDDIYDEDI